MNPKISVIVPVYNVEIYLHRCIDSILSQSFTDFELLLIDDGSPDNCGKICDEYAEQDNRVRVFHKPNGGVSSARNLGLDNARGEWITFVDSDDYVADDYLQDLFTYKENIDSDLVAISRMLDSGNSMVTLPSKEFTLLFSIYKFDKFCPPWGKLYRRNIIEQHNLRFNTQIHLGEDLMFVLSYLLQIKRITLISSCKYNYIDDRPDSLTKVLNSYGSELAGKQELDRIVSVMMENFDLDNTAMIELEKTQKYYTERTLISIMRLPQKKDRLQKLEQLDLTLYYKHKKPYSWKEWVLFVFLRMRFFNLFDFLIKVKG